MTLVGLDLNATRARAVSGASGNAPRPILLDGRERELPLALSLEGRRPNVGKAGLQLCRRLPHLACLDFLPHLDDLQGQSRQWTAGRHRIDAARAITLTLERLAPALSGNKGLAVAVPGYLSRSQATHLTDLAGKARLPVLGSVTSSLAAAAAAHVQKAWSGLALVADADEHALIWSMVSVDEPSAVRLLVEQPMVALSLRAWKERLLHSIADRCIRQSRRDLRDSADAEQGLYDQLDGAMVACRQGQTVDLVIQANHWYQNLLLQAGDFTAFCAPLVQQALDSCQSVLAAAEDDGSPSTLLLTPAVAQLPGLLPALQDLIAEQPKVVVVSADAVACGAHHVASQIHGGSLTKGHLDTAVPLTSGKKEPDKKPEVKVRRWKFM